jgi:hypothetical protein
MAIINEELVRDNSSRNLYVVSVFLVLLMSLVIVVIWSKLPGQIPLFFTFPWGEARLAPKILLAILPGLSGVFVVINIFLGKYYSNYPVLISRILASVSMAIAIMMSLAMYGILQAVL